jgi:hypothetical protein
MKTNVGSIDKIIRIIVGIALLAFFILGTGGLRYIGLIGIVPIATALFGFCPLYTVCGANTCKTTKQAASGE